MSTSNADLSAYPIIRLDELILLDRDTLRQASKDVDALLCKLRLEEQPSQMVFYLQKQLNAMQIEEVRREADQRVRNLLSGVESALNTTGYNEIVRQSTSAPSTMSSTISAPNSPLQYIPIRDRSSRSKSLNMSAPHQLSSAFTTERKVQQVVNVDEETYGGDDEHEGPSKVLTSSKALDAYQSVVNRDRKIELNESAIRTQKQKRIINEKFGNTFVVESTHKKIRFYPTKKTQQESPEAILAREKDRRRMAAMARLLERQELSKAAKERNKIATAKKREIAKARALHDVINGGDDDDSEETISGGDDNDGSTGVAVAVVPPTSGLRDCSIVDISAVSLSTTISPTRMPFNPNLVSKSSDKSTRRTVTNTDPDIPRKVLLNGLLHYNNLSATAPSPQKDAVSLEAVVSEQLSQSLQHTLLSTFESVPSYKENLNVDDKCMSALETIREMKRKKKRDDDRLKEGERDIAKTEENIKGTGLIDSLQEDVGEKFGQQLEQQQQHVQKAEQQQDEAEEERADCNVLVSSEKVTPEELLPLEVTAAAIATNSFSTSLQHPLPSFSSTMANSSLLYTHENNCLLISRKGVDDVPGLSSWRMVGNQWLYCATQDPCVGEVGEAQHALFVSRSKVQKSLPFGLVALLLEMEEFLVSSSLSSSHLPLSSLIPSSSSLSNEISSRLRAIVSIFDLRAIEGYYHFPSSLLSSTAGTRDLDLFSEINVCGNCYFICLKLERLLKGVILEADSRTISDNENKLEYRVNLSHENMTLANTAGHAAILDKGLGTLSKLFNLFSFDECEEVGALCGDEQQQPLVMKREDIREERGKDIFVDDRSILKNFAVVNRDAFDDIDRVQDDYSDDDDDDDDAFIEAPVVFSASSSHLFTITEEKELEEREHESIDPALNKTTTISCELIDPFLPITKVNVVPPVVVRLSDYYESIATIFPFAYSASGESIASATSGRLLTEAMNLQAQLYEQWLAIMKDYSTVFSAGNNTRKLVDAVIDASSNNASVYAGGPKTLHYRVTSSRSDVLNIINDAFVAMPLWEELPSGLGLGVSWNCLWTWSRPRLDMNHLLIWQRVNHFADSKQLTRKDLLKKNLQRYMDMATKTGKSSKLSFEIMPQSFILPQEYTSFVRVFTELESVKIEEKTNNYWIMKPVGLSRGRGISLVSDLGSLNFSQTSVIQKYVEKPLCLNGYKFDLRLYVLVTSFKPLEAFIYKEGFARISTQQYTLEPSEMTNLFVHLTNSSIQKHNEKGPSSDNPLSMNGDESNGSKISLGGDNGLWQRFKKAGIDHEAIWTDICTLVVKSLVVVDGQVAHQPCCFEVFGYDVLIDQDLRPWLLEVNASPSLARENQLDNRVKDAMVRDTIQLVDPAPFNRAAIPRIIRRRLKEIRTTSLVAKNDSMLESDLKEILGNYIPRRCGEIPNVMGNYEMLCPNTRIYDKVLKLKSKIILPGASL